MVRNRTLALAVLGGLALVAACRPQSPSQAYSDAAIPRPQGTEFADCDWKQVRGAHASMWGYDCGPNAGDQHLVADDALPGFVLTGKNDGKAWRRVVVRLFDKADDAPIDAILPAVRAASAGRADHCVLTPTAVDGGVAMELSPTGEAKTRWDRSEGDPPCGDMGVAYVGDRYFQAVPGRPDKVAWFDTGSEIQIFSPETLRVAQSPPGH